MSDDRDLVDGQELIDELCWRFGPESNNSSDRPTDPFADKRRDDAEAEVPSHDEVGEQLRQAVAYDGDDPAEWDLPDGEPLKYHALLRAREREPEMVDLANWELLGLIAATAYHNGIEREQVIEDLREHDRPGYEFDESKARKELRGVWRKAEAGNYGEPSSERLQDRGILPDMSESAAEIDDGDATADWSYVRALYGDDGDDTDMHARQAAAEALLDEQPIMTVTESDAVWRYDHEAGYYQQYGEEYLHTILEERLDIYYSIGERREIIDRVRARTRVRRDQINAADEDDPLVCVGNGVVNLRTGELSEHDESYHFIRGLEWDYDPGADRDRITDFFSTITEREADWKTLIDHVAHGLMPGHPYRAFVLTYGPGGNGKTQLGQLLRGFVGDNNAAGVELQDLADDDFATGALPGAYINVGDDVSIGEIRDTSALKTLTGGGTTRSNEKYEKKFEFKNEAAMFFSANEPPRFAEAKQSIDDRLYPIRMPYRFVDDPDADDPYERQKVPGIAEELLTDAAAMRGLLALTVEHAQRLLRTNGEYSMPEGPAERRARYEAASDPILRFVVECVEEGDIDDLILKDDAYSVYTALCDRDDDRPATEDVFKRKVSQQTTVDVQNAQTRQLTPGDDRNRAWKFVRFDDDATDLMPARLIERYFPGDEQAEIDEETDADEPESDDSTETNRDAFGAVPIIDAADTLTGYVTVTAEIVNTVGLGETNRGCKAVLKDASGAIDFVSWDAEMNDELRAREGDAVAIRNAEVSEYEGDHQLSPVEGLTTITTIQQGVGYTDSLDPEEAVQSDSADGTVQGGLDESPARGSGDASTDGGATIEGTKGRVHDYLREHGSASAAEIAEGLSVESDAVEAAVLRLTAQGSVIETDGQYELV
jgi:P4 family phage/plasmid primase-like protien